MIIKDKIYINIEELKNKLPILCEELTYPNPEYYEKKRLKLSVKKTSPVLFHYKIEKVSGKQSLLIPRGALERIKEFYTKYKMPYRILNHMVSTDAISVELNKDTILEQQQLKIINTLFNSSGGLIEASPGAGKTISMLGLISKVKQPTLILVHEHRLRSQWEDEIKKRLSGDFKLGRLDGDKKIDGDIVIGLIQSAHKKMDENPEWFNKFGMFIVDEVHHAPADTFVKVINNISAKYRIGITGTIKRKDGKHILMYDMFGKVLMKLDAKDIKHRITDFDFEIVNTNLRIQLPTRIRWSGRKREAVIDITNAITNLTKNQERNEIIFRTVVDNIEDGYVPLVLSDRVDHCKILHSGLTELGYNSILLIGESRKKLNWLEIREDESVDCLIATGPIASEGLDAPRLSSLHLTCPSSNLPKLKQKIGRIRRFMEGKPLPLVFDYVDNLAYYTNDTGKDQYIFKGGGIKRLHFYKQLKSDYNE